MKDFLALANDGVARAQECIASIALAKNEVTERAL
jgi:hypothetical protein